MHSPWPRPQMALIARSVAAKVPMKSHRLLPFSASLNSFEAWVNLKGIPLKNNAGANHAELGPTAGRTPRPSKYNACWPFQIVLSRRWLPQKDLYFVFFLCKIYHCRWASNTVLSGLKPNMDTSTYPRVLAVSLCLRWKDVSTPTQYQTWWLAAYTWHVFRFLCGTGQAQTPSLCLTWRPLYRVKWACHGGVKSRHHFLFLLRLQLTVSSKL